MAESVAEEHPAAPRSRPRSTLAAAGPDALAVLLLLGVLVVLWLRVRDLFPQVEFIDWISGNPRAWDAISSALDPVITFAGTYHGRSISLLYSTGIGKACGTDITCINTLAFLPVVATSLALYAAGRVLRLPVAAAAAVVLVLLLSEPSFMVLSWQATMHDRLAGAATFVMLIALFLGARHVRSGWVSPLVWAVGLTVLGFAAVNTKEPAWVALPLAATAPFLVVDSRAQAIRAARMLVLPLVVMGLHAAVSYSALADDPHVSKGAPWQNARILTDYVVPGGWVLGVVLVVLLAIGVLTACARAGWTGDVCARARITGWVAVAVACGWVIPLRTEFPSPFYMFVPIALAALAAALALRTIFLALPRHTTTSVRAAAWVVGVALTAWFVVGATTSRVDPYNAILDHDASFRATLPELVAVRTAHPGQRVQFAAPPEIYWAYRYMSGSPARDFWRMAGGPSLPQDTTYNVSVANDPAACGDAVTLIIQLDASLQPVGVCPR